MKKHSTLKAALAAVLAALMAFAAFPVSALPLYAAEKTEITPYWTVPEGYDEHDYNAIVSFLEIEDENGVKNGQKFCESYDPNDPTTWGEPEEPYEDEEYPEPIEGGYEDPYWYIGDFGFNEGTLSSFKSWNRDLVGFLDLSGCTSLESVWIENSRITGIDVSGCYALIEVYCGYNMITSLNLSECYSLGYFSCMDNKIKQIDFSDTLFDYSFVADGDGYVSILNWTPDRHYVYAQAICGAEFYGFFNSADEQLESAEFDDHYFLIPERDYDYYDDDYGYYDEGEHELITLRFAEPVDHETEWWVPAMTNSNDYIKLVNFLEQKDQNGVKNGTKLSESYHPAYYKTWGDPPEYGHNNVEWEIENYYGDTENEDENYDLDFDFQFMRPTMIFFDGLNRSGSSGTLDVSDFKLLTDLYCMYSGIDELIVTGCDALIGLHAGNNNLVSLDASGLGNLEALSCNSNNLEELNIAGSANLKEFSSINNPLTELDMSTNPKLTHDYIKAEGNGYIGYRCTNSSGEVYAKPAEGATFEGFFTEDGELISEGMYSDIYYEYYYEFNSSASGTVIARFKDAEEETVPAGYNEHDYNAIVSFLEIEDENGVKNGEKLSESYDPMDPETWGTTAFDYTFDDEQLGEMPCVEWQSVDGEKRLVSVTLPTDSMITFSGALDLSGCEQLRFLCCDHTQIEGLDVSGCTALKELHCQFNFMSMLNIDGAVSLEYLNCSFNPLYELDFTAFSELKVLICDECELNSLKVTGLSKLIELSCCAANFITELDVTGCTALRVLECFDASIRLSEMDLSDCSDLLRFSVSGVFAELDLSNCGYLLLDKVEAKGDGLITQYYENRLAWSNDDYYNIGMDEIEMNNEMAEISICAMPLSGATFEGFYDENGNFISEGELNEDYVYDPEANDFVMGEYYVLNLDEFPEHTTVIARFSGYEEEPTPGDVDGDGEVTALDALSIMRLLVSETDGSDMNVDAADMNGDGVVDILDALLALRMAIGAV